MPMSLAQLAQQIGADLLGNGDVMIDSCATLEDARPGQISFLANPKYAGQVLTTQASAVIVAPSVGVERGNLLKTKDPYYAFRQAMVLLHGTRIHPHQGIHALAHVEPSASIGAGTVVYPGVYVGPRVVIGRDCVLHPNVVIYEDCILGERVTVHAGTVIGNDGFGYATHKGEHYKIPQAGNVVIEDDVEIGGNCTIQRATLGSTVIGRGTKFGDLILVGHGVSIGAHGLLVAQVGIAGSVSIGHHVTMAGQVGVAGHLKIGDGVTIAAQAGVVNNVPDQSTIMGAPAMPAHHARRVYATFTQLPQLVERLKQLEDKIEELATKEEE